MAEDLLQEAFVRTLDKAGSLPVEATVPWFYPVFGVLLSPIIANEKRTVSSVSVIGNALRLRREDI